MTDVDYLSPEKNQCIMVTHIEVLSRAARGTGVVNGNRLVPTIPASMSVISQEGRIRIEGVPADTEEDPVELDAAHETLPRIDIFYRDENGDIQFAKGTPAEIEDPKNIGDWKSYTSPAPTGSVAAGAILGAVYVPPEATSIEATNIWMFAGGVEDIATEVSSPGSEGVPATEKAIAGELVKKISHSLDSAANDFLVGTGAGAFVKKSLAEVKAILGLGTAAYTASSDYATAAKGVTNGDTHDHISGRGAAITPAAVSLSATATVLGRKTTGAGAGEECSTSQILDFLGTATRGALIRRGASSWEILGKGSSGQILRQGENDADWATPRFIADFIFGDGVTVVVGQQVGHKIPIASKIIAAEVVSRDADGVLLTGSITCSIYVHDYNASIGNSVDSFALSSASSNQEASLNIAVAAGKYVTCVISGITDCKNVVLSLTFEAT